MSGADPGPLYCAEAFEALGLGEPWCCDSCHEDFDLGYSDLMEVALQDGREAFVCCKAEERIGRGIEP